MASETTDSSGYACYATENHPGMRWVDAHLWYICGNPQCQFSSGGVALCRNCGRFCPVCSRAIQDHELQALGPLSFSVTQDGCTWATDCRFWGQSSSKGRGWAGGHWDMDMVSRHWTGQSYTFSLFGLSSSQKGPQVMFNLFPNRADIHSKGGSDRKCQKGKRGKGRGKATWQLKSNLVVHK